MEIRYLVEMPRPSVRAAAQILGALALMHQGVRLMVSGGEGENIDPRYGTDLRAAIRPPRWHATAEAGRAAVKDGRWVEVPRSERYFIAQGLLQTPSPEDGLRLVSVRAGSVESVIEDIIEKIGEIFRRLLESTNSIVDRGDGSDLVGVLGGVAEAAGGMSPAVALGAGFVMVGAQNLRAGFEAHGVTGVDVQATQMSEA